jgi:hypothetical protein
MIGDTVTITYNSVATVLNRINQDNYAAEYLYRDATKAFRLRIRHLNESVAAGKPAFERHQVDLTRTEFDATNGDREYQAYTVIRLPKGSDPAVAPLLTLALNAFETSTNLTKVVGWES